MADLTGMMQAAAGGGGEENYIEDVFSTYLYTGNGATQTIINGIDLADKGGLTWFRKRTPGADHALYDSARGINKSLSSNLTAAQNTNIAGREVTAYTSTGFSLGTNQSLEINGSGDSMVSWTFREQPKFFDVVTYTGTGANRTVAHALGSVPGCIMVKRTDTTGDWQVYHRANTANPETDYLVLNSTAATADSDTRWNDTQPTAAVFSLGTEATVNASGGTYVAYLWAHDAGGFGLSGTDNVVSCSSYTGNATSFLDITLGYEPQWVMIKCSSAAQADGWIMVDTMRGMSNDGNKWLIANSSNAESAESARIIPTATGFKVSSNAAVNTSAATYIYIAIRRGPMKVPELGTSVFSPNAHIGTEPTRKVITAGFPVDLSIQAYRNLGGVAGYGFIDRLRGGTQYVLAYNTDAEGALASPDNFLFDSNTTLTSGQGAWNNTNANGLTFNLLRRAPSFFDEVCYTGTGSARTLAHNLTVVPELMIVKKRSATDDWAVYAGDNTDFLLLNTTAATADDNTYWNDTSPTSTVFSVGTNADVNTSAATYVAYLFATCPGVSKVGTYTGTAAAQTINCGFTAGARFVLIKRTDSTGDWYVWDSARGIVAGDDPYLLLNSTAAEVTNTDYIDTAATGFELTSTAPAAINASGGTYIFLAIA
jgi:hypothetical protein